MNRYSKDIHKNWISKITFFPFDSAQKQILRVLGQIISKEINKQYQPYNIETQHNPNSLRASVPGENSDQNSQEVASASNKHGLDDDDGGERNENHSDDDDDGTMGPATKKKMRR